MSLTLNKKLQEVKIHANRKCRSHNNRRSLRDADDRPHHSLQTAEVWLA